MKSNIAMATAPSFAAFVESSYTGAGRQCIDWCLAHGVPAVLFTRDPSPYAFIQELGDLLRVVVCDTTSADVVAEAAGALPGAAHFATTDDYSVVVVAELRKRFGQPTSDPAALLVCRNKALLRRTLQADAPWANPRFAEIHTGSVPRDFPLPAIVKPTSYTGSIGVRLCTTADEIVRHLDEFDAYVPPGSVGGSPWLLEEVLQGQEYSIECMDGEIVGFTRKSKFEPPWFIEKGHLFPAPLATDLRKRASTQLLAILDALELVRGPLHVEAYINSQGDLRIVEINARLGGGRIPQLVLLAGGPDLVDRYMAWVLGLPGRGAMPEPVRCAAIRFNVDQNLVAKLQSTPDVDIVEADARNDTGPSEPRSNLDRRGHLIAVTSRPEAIAIMFAEDEARTRTLRLTPARNWQLDQITRLHLAGLIDSASLSLDQTLDADLVDVESTYANGFFVVAAFDDEPNTLVGMGAILRIGDDWHVKRMRVDAAHRRRGIAQAVLDRLLVEARRLGASTLVLDTSVKQEAAQRLYERNGFVQTGNIEIGGIPSRLYRLTLPDQIEGSHS